ncbi:hypothetical protein [Cellvibrio fibrivorans]|uniref:Solute-binding protein family 3/N-terminal domain-containing protein n=1 Tax=Cellvibrio fibrivorans TaxID=126350 RepID=A0ABU1UTK0_9GAMM|nr:hypothetical protein [Cellvibrio fibrivorans]MDR7088501.1 hypothetical protein [Cellvibrio fibrivorans]
MKYVLLLSILLMALPTLAAPSSTTAKAPPEDATTTPNPMVVRYYDRGAKDARHAYKFELIAKILDVTRAEFGEYQLVPFGEEPSAKRQALLISEGKILNLLWASPGTVIARADVITVPVDILRGLLGYRVCLINPANFPASDKLHSLNQLQIAQGLNWADVEIYKHNGIHPKQAPTFEALFEMLAAKRFECLPLGADEVMYTWRDQKAKFPFLAVEPHVLIYYDYPIYLHISKQFPELAQRVKLGLQKLQRSGEFDRLFKQHHAADIAQLHLNQRKIFCLKSPYLPEQGQCEKPLNFPK